MKILRSIFFLILCAVTLEAAPYVKTYDTLAGLLSSNPVDVTTNAFISGFTNYNDGNQGNFTWLQGSTLATNASNIFKSTWPAASTNGRWYRLSLVSTNDGGGSGGGSGWAVTNSLPAWPEQWGRWLLRNWSTALVKLLELDGVTSPTVAFYGDSFVANQRMYDVLASYLWGKYGYGGPGFYSFVNGTVSPSTATHSGGWTESDQQTTSYGLDISHISSTNAADYATWTGTANKVWLWYIRQPGGGTISVTLDGTTLTNIVTTNTVISFATYAMTGLSTASHTLLVTNTVPSTGGVILIGGNAILNAPGVVIHRVGNSGLQATQVAAANQSLLQAQFAELGAHVVLTKLGVNDITVANTPAQVTNALGVLYRTVVAGVPLSDFVLTTPPDRGVATTYPTTNYVNLIQNLAADMGVPFWNDYQQIGPFANANSRGMFTPDMVHIQTNGAYVDMAALLKRMFDPPATLSSGSNSLPANIVINGSGSFLNAFARFNDATGTNISSYNLLNAGNTWSNGQIFAYATATNYYAVGAEMVTLKTTGTATGVNDHRPSPSLIWQLARWNGSASIPSQIFVEAHAKFGSTTLYGLNFQSSDKGSMFYISGANGGSSFGSEFDSPAGTVNANVGYLVAGASSPVGYVLASDGTRFVPSATGGGIANTIVNNGGSPDGFFGRFSGTSGTNLVPFNLFNGANTWTNPNTWAITTGTNIFQPAAQLIQLATTATATDNVSHRVSPSLFFQGATWNGSASIPNRIYMEMEGILGVDSAYGLHVESSDKGLIAWFSGDGGGLSVGSRYSAPIGVINANVGYRATGVVSPLGHFMIGDSSVYKDGGTGIVWDSGNKLLNVSGASTAGFEMTNTAAASNQHASGIYIDNSGAVNFVTLDDTGSPTSAMTFERAASGSAVKDVSFPTGYVKVAGNLTVAGNITNAALTATALVAADGNKALKSVLLGAGISYDGTTLSATGSGGTVTGSATANYVAVWSSSSALTGFSGFQWNSSSNLLVIAGNGASLGNGIILTNTAGSANEHAWYIKNQSANLTIGALTDAGVIHDAIGISESAGTPNLVTITPNTTVGGNLVVNGTVSIAGGPSANTILAVNGSSIVSSVIVGSGLNYNTSTRTLTATGGGGGGGVVGTMTTNNTLTAKGMVPFTSDTTGTNYGGDVRLEWSGDSQVENIQIAGDYFPGLVITNRATPSAYYASWKYGVYTDGTAYLYTLDNSGNLGTPAWRVTRSGSTPGIFKSDTAFEATTTLQVDGDSTMQGDVLLTTVGKALKVKAGSNGKAGTFTLVAGAATVSNTSITTGSVVCTSIKTSGGTPSVYQPAIVLNAGTGFSVTGLATDTSTYNYVVIETN